MQCLSLAGNDSDRGRASAGAVSVDSAPTSLKGMACKGQQENGGFGCWPNARREGRRLRLGEKTKKETKKKKKMQRNWSLLTIVDGFTGKWGQLA